MARESGESWLERKAGNGMTAREVEIAVHLAPDDESTHTIYAQLTLPAGAEPRSLQILLPGAMYSGIYWDSDFSSGQYSYVDYMVRRGHATLNVDRLGIGRSDHPHSTKLTLESNVVVLHDIVSFARSGGLGFVPERVVTVGHSYGTLVASREAADFNDVDAVILTAALHSTSAEGAEAMGQKIATYVASQEPQFSGLDDGYVTSMPGTRMSMLYREDNVDPGLVELDEETKETVSLSEMAGLPQWQADGTTGRLTVPSLIALGDTDIVWCGPDSVDCSSAESVLAAERHHYPEDMQPDVFVLQQSGHDINFQHNFEDWYAMAASWLDSVLEQSAREGVA